MRLSDIGLTLKDVNLGAPDAESDYDLENYFVNTPHVDAMRPSHTIAAVHDQMRKLM